MHRATPATLRLAALLPLIALASLSCKSATPLMETSARTAADQLADLEAEIARKITVENKYYTEAQKQLTASLVRDRSDQFQLLLDARARSFAGSNRGATLSDDALNGFLTGFLDSWQSQESQIQSSIQTLSQQLDQGRQTLEANAAKVKELQNKLRALGQARSKGELARFVFEFTDGTLSQLAADVAGSGDAGGAGSGGTDGDGGEDGGAGDSGDSGESSGGG